MCTHPSRFPLATLFAAVLPAQDWSLRTLPANPAAATFPRMVYDVQRNRCVEFGGWNAPFGTIVFADTWEYDGITWTLRTPATVPDERDSHSMAYDSARGRTVMFGGWDFNFVLLGQTWEWDGTDWVDRAPANAPSARKLSAMATTVAGTRRGTDKRIVGYLFVPPGRAASRRDRCVH